MTIPKVRTVDILNAFMTVEEIDSKPQPRATTHHGERLRLAQEFTDHWNTTLGHLFECPSRSQIFTWLRMSGWDTGLLDACISDLRNRANSLPPLDATDPYQHD